MNNVVIETIKLIDGSEASKTMVDIVYGCLLDLSQTNQAALAALVKKCRDESRQLYQPILSELAQMNLVRLNGQSYDYIVPIVLTMTDGQTGNFKPVHPVPDQS